MPGFQGFTCPPNTPTAGEHNNINHCVVTCPHKCAAPGLLMSIYQAEQKNHHVGNYISASMLTGGGCARQVVLERLNDYYLEPKKIFWPFRGTIAHRCVEDGAEALRQFGWLSEVRMAVPFEYSDLPTPVMDEQGQFTGEFDFDTPLTIVVGGTTDSYNFYSRELWDFKSCADTKAHMMIMGQKPGTFSPNLDDAWVWQVNIYRLLISKTRIPEDIAAEFNLTDEYYPAPESLAIQAISMMEIPRSGMSYYYKNYVKGKRGKQDTIQELEPVPVFPLEEIEEFVRAQALQWYRGIVLGELPPVVDKDKEWLCKNCVFNGHVHSDGICFPETERNQLKEK